MDAPTRNGIDVPKWPFNIVIRREADGHPPWRSTFKTICADAGKDREAVEAHLDHLVGNKTESACDRAKRLELRRKVMQWYDPVWIAARDGGQVVALRAEAR